MRIPPKSGEIIIRRKNDRLCTIFDTINHQQLYNNLQIKRLHQRNILQPCYRQLA